MTFFTHTVSAGVIAYLATSTSQAPNLIWWCLIPPALLDLDHLYYILKDRKKFKKPVGTLHEARSPLHEVAGIAVVGIISLIISLFNPAYAVAFGVSVGVHILQDILMGISRPYYPYSKELIRFFTLSFKQKVIIEVIIFTLSLVLWKIYL
jgi:hypothetical protein